MKPFLHAEWKNLIMVNYEINPEILLPFLPKGTELDFWKGKCFISLVGFLFLKSKVYGIPLPFQKFEEVNLRFYVKSGDKRGVVFIKELIPSKIFTFLVKKLYNENYICCPMQHTEQEPIEYRWCMHNEWQHLKIETDGVFKIPEKNSLDEFISEHYWGYVSQKNGRTKEYHVTHPQWLLSPAKNVYIHCHVKELYGEQFVSYLKNPTSAFLAKGSAITVSKGYYLYA